MNNLSNGIRASWLHISDLHVFHEADTTLMLDDYPKLANIISPQFLVATGDFRYLGSENKTDFSLAKNYLESIMRVFGIEKTDTFLVPGNHDVNEYDERSNAISTICEKSNSDYSIYSKYLSGDKSLYKGFHDYETFIRAFYYESGVTDERVTNPGGVYCITWNNLLNILSINTALICDGGDHNQIIDINSLSQCRIDLQHPTIMLGHHGIDSLYLSHSERIKGIIDRRRVSAYLHGDSHKYANQPISQISVPNRSIPSITCAKSAPQSGDSFSDLGVVYYEWRNDGNTYVQAYRWTQKGGFIEDSSYYYDIDKRYFFPMIDNQEERVRALYRQIKDLMNDHDVFAAGDWVEEAESIWQESNHEGIGRCLLVFYCEQVANGIASAQKRAQEIYYTLALIPDRDLNTQKMLEATKGLLNLDKY